MFKMEGDVMMYVVGGGEENEVLLYSVVLCLRDALGILLKWVFLWVYPFFLPIINAFYELLLYAGSIWRNEF